jgi:hypothetical protein
MFFVLLWGREGKGREGKGREREEGIEFRYA